MSLEINYTELQNNAEKLGFTPAEAAKLAKDMHDWINPPSEKEPNPISKFQAIMDDEK